MGGLLLVSLRPFIVKLHIKQYVGKLGTNNGYVDVDHAKAKKFIMVSKHVLVARPGLLVLNLLSKVGFPKFALTLA